VSVIYLIWGTDPRPVPVARGLSGSIRIADLATITTLDLALVITATIVWVVVVWATTGAGLGLKMRATAENVVLASSQGVRLVVVVGAAWALGSAVAAAAGIAYGARLQIDSSVIAIGLLAIPAAMIGGLDSPLGTLPGGFIMGWIQAAASALFGSSASLGAAAPYLILFVVLLVRPTGLFGTERVSRI
jgi:branched-chain amino acid transport system permease protein